MWVFSWIFSIIVSCLAAGVIAFSAGVIIGMSRALMKAIEKGFLIYHDQHYAVTKVGEPTGRLEIMAAEIDAIVIESIGRGKYDGAIGRAIHRNNERNGD